MILYNYLLKILLEKAFTSVNNNFELKIILDRCMNRYQRDNFQSYIESEFLSLFQVLPKIDIIHESSQNEMGLQVVDFICGAFRQKYNSNSHDITNIFKNKIIVEKNDLFKRR